MFDPKPHLLNLKGKDYLPVAPRVAWLVNDEKSFVIKSEILRLEDTYAIVRATVTIFDETGSVGREACGTKREDKAHFPDFLEKAETGAVGRALALLGFGTLFAQELDEIPDPSLPNEKLRPVDKPEVPQQKHLPTTATTATTSKPQSLVNQGLEPMIDHLHQMLLIEAPQALSQKCPTYPAATSLKSVLNAKMHHRPDATPAKLNALHAQLVDLATKAGLLP